MSTALSVEHPATPTRALSVALCLGQVVLAAMFAIAAGVKAFTPLSELAPQMPLATDAPILLRFIGISELAGAVGVILPAVTRIKPWLTPLAAFGLFVIMVLASLFHLVRGELGSIGVTAMLGAIA